MRLTRNAIVKSNNYLIGKIAMPSPIKIFLLLFAFAAPMAEAEVLLLDAISEEPANTAQGLPRPSRGMTMDQVRSSFGEPIKEHPWVGEPPITRWDYEKFSVFFEHQYVLDSIVHRK